MRMILIGDMGWLTKTKHLTHCSEIVASFSFYAYGTRHKLGPLN